jgi:thiol-disulfide isomerase/thioredoxin
MKLKSLFTLIFFLIFHSSIFAQWTYAELNNFKTDVIINYEIIYEKTPSEAEKNNPSFLDNIVVVFNNKGVLKHQKFYKDLKISTYYSIGDYKNKKMYSCYSSSSSRTAISSDFGTPKKQVEIQKNQTKDIFGFNCTKSTTLIRGLPKDIYFTKDLGLRYCQQFDVDGFLLEYPGYDKKLGHYKVVAKNIYYKNLDPSILSLDNFKIYTKDEYDDLKKESTERYAIARQENIGKDSKNFKMHSINGKKLSSKDMEGEVIVLNFWFTTCPPCKKEIPELNKLKEAYKTEKVNFIGIATDPEYKLAAFLKNMKFDYDIVAEGRWLADKYDINSYPTNIVIDKDGTIQLFEIGYKSDIIERMKFKIDNALNQLN